MSDRIDEIKNQSEFFISRGSTYKPSDKCSFKYEKDIAREFNKLSFVDFAKSQRNDDESKKIKVAKKSLENFCDDQYRFYLSKLKNCEGRLWYSESFDHSHNSNCPDVHTELAYCYNQGLYFAETENNNTSIFAVIPTFVDNDCHFTFYGATRTLLTDKNGKNQFAFLGYVRKDCKSHVFQDFFPEDSIISKLSNKCPITGIKASYLFASLMDRYMDCKQGAYLLSKNDDHSTIVNPPDDCENYMI